jgi:hypothetical protein
MNRMKNNHKPHLPRNTTEEGETLRKYGSTTCRNNEQQMSSIDDKDTRGRWRARHNQSDNYDDPELPFVDARVASILCIGAACTYVAE